LSEPPLQLPVNRFGHREAALVLILMAVLQDDSSCVIQSKISKNTMFTTKA